MIALGMLLGVFVLLVVGLFGFEVNRVELGREQLTAACDAAALAGAATLASSDNLDPATAQTEAMNTALTTFQQNSVLGTQLTAAAFSASSGDVPSANGSSIFIQFLDPHNNNQAVALGDPNGKIVQVSSAFGLTPAFGKFLGLKNLPIYSTSSGGVPQLDVVLCFDVSASMDDQTKVSFVKRTWSSAQAKNLYTVASTSSGAPAGSLAQGTIFDIVGPPATGTALDAVPPQNLSQASAGSYSLTFSPTLRGTPNAGSPPGNYSGGSTGTAQTFTDLVVNVDGKSQFAGTTLNGVGAFAGQTYNVPNLATLVEAARGNLESTTVFQNSKANASVPSNVTPKAGYLSAYNAAAAANLHPIYDAQDASNQFFNIMNTNTDAHFGLVCFTSNAGTSLTTTYNMDNIDSSYTAGGSNNFACPLISLNPAIGSSNYTQAEATLPTLGPVSGTNIGDAVNRAVTELKTHCRTGAKKAIVLFTDGQPTAGGPLNNDPWANARAAAVAAKTAGIPIYTIGLAQTPAIIPGETQILNDTNPSTSAGGMAAIAGNGGKFFLVTNVADLRLTFENIARQLVQLVR